MIEKLVEAELKRANSIHRSFFCSAHEGESIIREEVQEAKEEMDSLGWTIVDFSKTIRYNKDDLALREVKRMRFLAERAVTELIEVMAMCDKFVYSQEQSWGRAK